MLPHHSKEHFMASIASSFGRTGHVRIVNGNVPDGRRSNASVMEISGKLFKPVS